MSDTLVSGTFVVILCYYIHLRVDQINDRLRWVRVYRRTGESMATVAARVGPSVTAYAAQHRYLCQQLRRFNSYWCYVYLAFLIIVTPMNLILLHQVAFDNMLIVYRMIYCVAIMCQFVILFGVQYYFAVFSRKMHAMYGRLSRLQWCLGAAPGVKWRLTVFAESLNQRWAPPIGLTIGPTVVITFDVLSKIHEDGKSIALAVLEIFATLASVTAADVTKVLRDTTYWGSYNVPYFQNIYNMSGTGGLVEKWGEFFSYKETARALIFKRDQSTVTNLNTLYSLMRYNNFQHDSLSQCHHYHQECQPGYAGQLAIAVRHDLNSPTGQYLYIFGRAIAGAMDAKMINKDMAARLEMLAVSGPTHRQQPPFRWSTSGAGAELRHIGHPDVFDFKPIYTKWADLELKSYNTFANNSLQAYMSGRLEGYITGGLIHMHYHNVIDGFCGQRKLFCDALKTFHKTNTAFINTMISSHANDDYWHQMALIYDQIQGLEAGYENWKTDNNVTQQTNETNVMSEIWWLNLMFETSELEAILTPNSTTIPHQDHCLALVKVLPDSSDLYVAHNLWFPYGIMIRIMKQYSFAFKSLTTGTLIPGHSVSMSSYPGFIFSGDDYYVLSSGLVVQETTNNNFNQSLYSTVRPNQVVLEFARTVVANRLATGGRQWTDIFGRYNSGTYNNQFMIVDYILFTKGTPIHLLPDNLLLVWERMPSTITSADVTKVLRDTTYWGSSS
ncbi:unnamed protein product [Medioppia subpectinata]|uniref:Phospholipase B-like n=1 Tax=Medioppia subpectinata TaxID=1979941 RepID=A0A7R9KC56_9ACAR|nr:unnamed protein product [Medioppia subpectinata]CAG2100672.1 unnamed protein product [Medioppia subpectinata]